MQKASVLVAACLSLAGCTTVLADRSAAGNPTDMADYFTGRMEAGKAFLAAGQPTRAIEAFRQASYHPAYRADAMNGMGVAYGLLGRHDVAQAMFLRSVALAPGDLKFARNLARADAILAQPDAPTQFAAALDAQHPSMVQAAPALAGPSPAITTTAVLLGEGKGVLRPRARVAVELAPHASSAKARRAATVRPVVVSLKPTETVRSSHPTYAVRITLPEARPAGWNSLPKGAYPVRLALKAREDRR
jgi:tetratricopeptide (TPR) repeat protein